MALYDGDSGGGRHGPYWRRQLGQTRPGELTLQQLNQINLLRQRMGLPPLNSGLSDRQMFPTHPGDPRTTPGPPPFIGMMPGQLRPVPGRGQLIPLPRPAPINVPRQVGPFNAIHAAQIHAILPQLMAQAGPRRRQPYASPLRAGLRQRSFAL